MSFAFAVGYSSTNALVDGIFERCGLLLLAGYSLFLFSLVTIPSYRLSIFPNEEVCYSFAMFSG